MKSIVNSVIVRLTLSAVVFTALVTCPQLRVPLPVASAASAPTEAQLKSEAASYDSAMRAISGIITMKLATADDLKQANAIVGRARPGLNLFRSKLIVLALRDPTFTDAVKKTAVNQSAAEDLLKGLNADPRAVLKLGGAEGLQRSLEQSLETDAATLRRAGEALKAAAAKLKQSRLRDGAPDTQAGFQLIRAKAVTHPVGSAPTPVVDPVTILVGIAIAAAVVVAVIFAVTAIRNLYDNLFTKQGRDRVADCRKDADDRLADCIAAADRLSFPFNISATAECEGQWLISQGECLVTTN